MFTRTLSLTVLLAGLPLSAMADETPITITTWNIEHFGSPGRGFGGGFGGYGRGSLPERTTSLPRRTEDDFEDIADFILHDLGSEVIAIQELGVTGQRKNRSICEPLEVVIDHLEASSDSANWAGFLPQVDEVPWDNDEHNVHLGFLWNQERVRMLKVFEMSLENQELGVIAHIERKPLVGYFEEVRPDGSPGFDFVLINVHLASGQDRVENHLIAMTLIEFGIARDLARNAISESAIVILGDFNDNPVRAAENGELLSSPALHEHLRFKGYTNLTTADMGFTRMNSRLNSLIDHVLVNTPAQAHLIEETGTIYRPGDGENGDPELFADWRLTFSDHFPITFSFKGGPDDDSDFFD